MKYPERGPQGARGALVGCPEGPNRTHVSRAPTVVPATCQRHGPHREWVQSPPPPFLPWSWPWQQSPDLYGSAVLKPGREEGTTVFRERPRAVTLAETSLSSSWLPAPSWTPSTKALPRAAWLPPIRGRSQKSLGGSVGSASDFGLGHDLAVRGFEARVGLCADSSGPGACFGFWVSLSLRPSPTHTLSLSLKDKD